MIAAANADRNVAITLQLVAGQQNAAIAQKVGAQVVDAEKRGTKAAESESRRRTDLSKQEAREKAAAVKQAERDKLKAERDAQKEREAIRKAEQRELELNLREKAKAAEKAARDEQKQRDREERERIKAEKAAQKEKERLEKAAIKDKEKAEKEKTKIAEREAKERERAAAREAKAIERYNKEVLSELKAAQSAQIEGRRKATEAGVGALQGMMDLAEGAAILGLTSEENFEKFARMFIKVQAGFKAMKGLTELFWKGREAILALNEATKAKLTVDAMLANNNLRLAASQSAANAVGGVAGGAVGGATGRGAGGAAGDLAAEVGGDVAGGALGAKMVGGGVGAKTGMGLLAKAGGAAGWLTLAAAAGVALFESIQLVRRGISGANEANESFVGSITRWRREVSKAAESTKNLEREQKTYGEREKSEQRFTTVEGQAAGYRQMRRNATAMQSRINTTIGGAAANPIEEANRERRAAIQGLIIAEQEYAEVQRKNQERIKNGQNESAQERLRAARMLAEANQQLIDSEERRLKVMRDQKKAAEDQIKVQQDAVKSAQDAQKSMHQRFSELDPYDQGELKRITAKVQNGEDLNDRDIRQLKRIPGFGDQIVRDYEAKKGLAAGSGNVASVLGDGYKESQKREAEETKKLNEARAIRAQATSGEARSKRYLKSASDSQPALIDEQIAAQRDVDDQTLQRQAVQNAKDNIEEPEGSGEAIRNDFGAGFKGNARGLGARARAVKQSTPQRQPDQQAAANAADEVAQSGIGVEQALKIVLDAVAQNNVQLQASIENSELMKGYYNA